MPYYVFECGSCHDVREYRVPSTGNVPQRCSSCDESSSFTRVYSKEGFSISDDSRRDNKDIYSNLNFQKTVCLSIDVILVSPLFGGNDSG